MLYEAFLCLAFLSICFLEVFLFLGAACHVGLSFFCFFFMSEVDRCIRSVSVLNISL